MNEAQWLASTDPQGMLQYLQTGRVVESTSAGYPVAYGDRLPVCTDRKLRLAAVAFWWRNNFEQGAADAAQASLLRCIFGNPFRPVEMLELPRRSIIHWHDGTVVRLAQAIYEGRCWDRLPILADALEEAGCDNADLLAHLRVPGPHARGCWVLDCILGKE